MHVAELWRYPVKCMAGESLKSAELGQLGILGDRIVHVEDGQGRVLTARTHPRLLALRPTLGPDGEPLVDGRPWSDPEIGTRVETSAEAGARLVKYEGPERFDVLPLLVATDGAIAALGVDGRRLRPNVVIGGVDGLAEREWPGGDGCGWGQPSSRLLKLRGRCVMTTYDPDTQEQNLSVLRRIVREFGGHMALDCAVAKPGPVAGGDPVEMLEP